MANQEQVDRLRQGVKDWNTWREKCPTAIDLSFADLNGADLNGADLNGAHFIGTHPSNTIYSGASLTYIRLSGANLSRANLNVADLIGADLSEANLRGTDLIGANLSEANLSRADLSRANLRGAELIGANLKENNLSGANLSSVRIGGTTFGDIDLRQVKGLETVKHWGPSTIGTDTLLRSEGTIPESFLRGAGLTDAFIDYVRSLSHNPIKYDTCFISYSSKDQDFAEQLYTNLQSKGVRCWFAPEDLKIGDEFWRRIDESIRQYDKLLVVLSHSSVQSDWVEREVLAALEKEQSQRKTVLFPIKLDETIMQASLPWAANIRRSRHIGDFTQWKHHDHYQKALTRLLRDLQPASQP